MLTEGNVEAILRTPFGERFPIPERMWDKEPLKKKVYPRFKDGWMRFRLDVPIGRFVKGWVFVPKGAFDSLATRHPAFAPDQSRKGERRINREKEAILKNKIGHVLAEARRGWPNPKKQPPFYAMAKKLERTIGKKIGYGHVTIRKILNGTYRPMRRRDISGL